MKKEPSVAIIILNWNGAQDTIECLRSLEKIKYNNYNIVLVDNASSNDEAEELKAMFPYIHLIRNKENRGFAGGNNDGMNWALKRGFEYIVNLNNDTIAEEDWLKNLIQAMVEKNADFGSSRIMFYPDTDLIYSDEDRVCPDGSAIAIHRNDRYDGKDRKKTIYGASGAASIYSAKCLREVKIKQNQYFDELFFAYNEDVDLAVRLFSISCKGISVPKAVIYHKHSKTAGKYSVFKMFHSEKNRIMTEILNFPIFLLVAGEIFFLIKCIFILLRGLFKKGKGKQYISNMNILDLGLSFIRARFWVLCNLSQILEDRRERKTRGFIRYRVVKMFEWDLMKISN